MSDFAHIDAHTLAEATTLAAADPVGVRVLAGGTDLLGTLKDRVHARYPQTIVNLKTIPGLDELREDDAGLHVGALVRLDQLEHDPVVRARYPLLAAAARAVGAPQLRGMGTVGGNLCQEPRCWYYRAPENVFPCLRKGGARCPAFTGENRYHSIFGSIAVSTRPCTAACPGSVGIPEYMGRLRAGDTAGAARILLAANPMPAITGRVCPHACEGECSRAAFDSSVSVRAVERYLGDWVLDAGAEAYGHGAPATGRRVAVVGSGPAGLAAAFSARQSGHAVTVFERASEPGGMLRWAIPAYRLPAEVVRRLLASYEALGIEFVTGVEVGVDRSLTELRAEYDAVFVGPGAWGRPGLQLPGAEVLQRGLDFLSAARGGEAPTVGRQVVVVGGGNVAIDVAVAAKRLGAERVTIVALEAACDLPAFTHEVDRARDEGVEIVDSCGVAGVVTDDEGRLTGLRLAACTCVFDGAGRFAPVLDESQLSTIVADQVMLAIGQTVELGSLLGAPPSAVAASAELPVEHGRLLADADTGAANTPGVYAGGDAVSGPASVIAAIAAGRRAAAAIDAYLAASAEEPAVDPATGALSADDGPSRAPGFASGLGGTALQAFAPDCLRPLARALPAEVETGRRTPHDEDAPVGITAAEADAEAARCFDCGCVAATPSDLAPALVALDAVIVTTERDVPSGDFFAARIGSSTILAPGELVTGVRVPVPRAGARSAYHKFRLRQAIDFPIVGVACLLRLADGVVVDPRIVLGAAAPVPIRSTAAEAYLSGRRLDAATAREAGRIAVAACLPLGENAYKVKIAAELVRRALVGLVDQDG